MPESEPALAEIAKLLKNDAALKLNVVGHTDNDGALETNMKLSEARAAAVVQALVAKYGIASARLRSFASLRTTRWVGSPRPFGPRDDLRSPL